MRVVLSFLILCAVLLLWTRGNLLILFSGTGWLPLLIGIAAFVVLATIARRINDQLQARRDRGYAAYCQSRGFEFVGSRPGAEAEYAGFWLFDQGYARTVQHEFSGTNAGHRFRAFEYTYTTGGGRATRLHEQGVITWTDVGANLPEFTLGPEYPYNRITQVLGSSDIDFPEDPAFSNAYVLKAPNEGEIAGAFTPQVRAFLAANRGQHVSGSANRLIWWLEGRLPPPELLDAFLSDGAMIRDLFLTTQESS